MKIEYKIKVEILDTENCKFDKIYIDEVHRESGNENELKKDYETTIYNYSQGYAIPSQGKYKPLYF